MTPAGADKHPTPMRRHLHEPLAAVAHAGRWAALAAMIGVLAGLASAVFLLALEWATVTRESHLWLVALLPIAGFAIGLIYAHFGTAVEAGNNLVLDEIHDPTKRLPLRMAPMILVSTVATHLFGGSAGREGTAVQMGASLADQVVRFTGLDRHGRRIALMAGISGGFGAVFGTPLAGMVFGLEVLVIGAIRFEALFPCLVAAVVGDRVVTLLGVHHTVYTVATVPALGLITAGSAIAVGLASGVMARVFTGLTHQVTTRAKAVLPWGPARLAAGGALVALAALALGTSRHLGLGIPMILDGFQAPAPWSDCALKLVLTAVTLGFGFKGGEVTPLFVIGATLGSALAVMLPVPVDVLAGLGFVAVFAGAANTPLACILMACELFGSGLGVLAALACVSSYLVSGHTGIYRAQRLETPKPGT